jgi:hypothetical protein
MESVYLSAGEGADFFDAYVGILLVINVKLMRGFSSGEIRPLNPC